MKSIIFINSHPIQYFAPLYKYMNEQGVKTKTWYCYDKSINGGMDMEFGMHVKWDIPLLDGYEYRFFKNHSWKPSLSNGFFGLINLGMIREIFRMPKSVIIVHGWHYCTHLIILILGGLKGHTICLRNESPYKQEVLKKGWKQKIKKIALKYLLFPRIHHFLYIGVQNLLLYKSYGLSEKRLVFCPYSVDNSRFRLECKKLKAHVSEIKYEMDIPVKDKVILYSGKYIDKKRPLDLLQAFIKLNNPTCWLIMIGEGELRKEMEEIINKFNVKQVVLTGFINQSMISKYYAIGDLFVMCSNIGETWGLSVNEAMNFGLPVLISDLTGCSEDLVREGVNGYTFRTGNVDDLALKLRQILFEDKLIGSLSSEMIVDTYSYSTILDHIRNNIL